MTDLVIFIILFLVVLISPALIKTLLPTKEKRWGVVGTASRAVRRDNGEISHWEESEIGGLGCGDCYECFQGGSCHTEADESE